MLSQLLEAAILLSPAPGALFGTQLVDPAALVSIELEVVEAPEQFQVVRPARSVQGIIRDLLAAQDRATDP